MKYKYFIILITLLTSLHSLTIKDFRNLGETNLIKQNYYNAIENFKEAIQLNSSDKYSLKGLSDSFFMLGEYEEALLYIDICIGLNKNDLELKNCKGRILTALEDYIQAEAIYRAVIDTEMYNVGAQSGLAELRIVSGDLKGSLYDFEKILKFSPNSRRLLLSLVVLNDNLKDFENADKIIQKAIRHYPQDPIVLEAAVRHYMNTKSYQGALLYMDELIKISDNIELKLLNAELLIYLNEYKEALNILSDYMKVVKDDPESYYIAAIILDAIDEKNQAISLMKRGLDLKPDEEIYRFFSEKIVNDHLILKDEKRSYYSNWYYEKGKLLEGRYYYEKAKTYYLRGLDLDPFSKKLRLAYGEILNKMGFRQRYLKEMDIILDRNPDDIDIKETLLIQRSLPTLNIYEKWGAETFKFDNRFTLSLFIKNSVGENHLKSANIIKDITSRFLSGQSHITTEEVKLYNGNYSSAFNLARDANSEYFVLFDFLEGNRTFSLNATLHLTKSGREIQSFSYLKTGNNRIFNCFENFSKDLNNFFPIIGSITNIKGQDILINSGKMDNIEVEHIYDVVKKRSIELIPEEPYLRYEADKFLGTVEITDVGEGMSSGVFTGSSNFNLLNIGDKVLLFEKTEVEEIESEEDIIIKEESIITDKELIEQLLQVN
ncbi:MAG: hypothetical protein OCD02_21545 [Spirochaetaceae bacterium]